MMNKRRIGKRIGFTLIELLVVISIIALLLAILMPALQKVKRRAEAVVCLNLIKQMALANVTYATSYDGYFVDSGWRSTSGMTVNEFWCLNKTFLSMVGMTQGEISNVGKSDTSTGQMGAQWPKSYLCPTFIPVLPNQFDHVVSYGYNRWWGWGGNRDYRDGHISRPSEKIMFVDSQQWWMSTVNADPTIDNGWNANGQTKSVIRPDGRTDGMGYPFQPGVVMYRHNEGTNAAYFDGSAGHRKKEETFYFIDDDPLGAVDDRRNDKLWVLFLTD